jgi:hypothetical protein
LADNINSPNHYNKGDIEVIDYILDQKFDYLEGNVIKYVSRYRNKGGIEDLRKAKWYLEKLIDENLKHCDNKLKHL